MRTPINRNQQSGYILIELAVVFVVAGFLLAVSFPLYNTYIQKNALIETHKRMDIIAKAYSNYIQMRGRLPCPASPLDVVGTAFGTERATCLAAGVAPLDNYGIIPYRTLGIPEQYAKDGWGNFFTYAVSPDFTRDTRLGVAPNTVQRRLAHLVAEDKYALLPLAQFCAPIVNSGNDLIIQDEAGVPLYSFLPRVVQPIPRPTIGTPNANLFRDDQVTGIAMALISHGENGFGSFQSNGAQISPAAGGNIEDVTNIFDGTIQVRLDIANVGGNNEYDDIIKFYTQDQIMGAAGGGSCEHL